tara:strand:+ start:2810 stop:2989 length:180 start_codon:yes stop_codon:yes gene_type:complete
MEEELNILRAELSEAYANICMKQSQLDLAKEGLEKIKDSYDIHKIAEKYLDEIEYLGQK